MSTEKYVTRVEGVRLVNETLGVPLSLSTLEKDARLGRGPKPVARYGTKLLYTPEEFLRYARDPIVRLDAEA